MELVECIPNISEGRNRSKIEALSAAITSVNGVSLLDVDSGYAANRTVFTFVGDCDSVHDAACMLYQKAFELIDMRTHKGTHPRMGAVDVCPFVPLSGCSTNTLIDMSMRLGHALAENLEVCGYFYEYSAIHYDRLNLSALRKGGYEALPQKIKEMPPDFGPYKNWPRFGCTVLGARKLLVAYNVNLDTRDVNIAKQIAAHLRSAGKGKNKLAAAKSIGWFIEDFDRVQVSFNLTDLNQTGLGEAFEACKREAEALGCQVTGSELVGLVPEAEFVKVYARLAGAETGLSKSLSENQLEEVISYLGLREVKAFDPNRKIIERLTQSLKLT